MPYTMSRRHLLRAGLALGASAMAPGARACEFFAANLRVTHPWTRVTPADAPFAVVCMKIDQVTASDRLIGVETPVATGAQIGGISTPPGLNLLIERGQDFTLNEEGLHLRPITLLVRCATTFSSSISLFFDGHRADAKSAFDLMLLAAPCGAILNLEVSGQDADAAADSICGLFEQGFVISGPAS